MNSTAALLPGQARIQAQTAPLRVVAPPEPDELAAALEMLALGYRPVATYPTGHARADGTASNGKSPIGRDWGLSPWSPAKLRAAFDRYPGAGVGACLGPGCGPGGSWLIDLEGDGPEADDSLSRMLAGELIETPSWASARGKHYLFVVDGALLLSLLVAAGASERRGVGQAGTWHVDALPGLEWRVGGDKLDGTRKQLQSIVPPTPGTDGRPREWIVSPRTPVAPLPEAAYAALEDVAERIASSGKARAKAPPRGD